MGTVPCARPRTFARPHGLPSCCRPSEHLSARGDVPVRLCLCLRRQTIGSADHYGRRTARSTAIIGEGASKRAKPIGGALIPDRNTVRCSTVMRLGGADRGAATYPNVEYCATTAHEIVCHL